MELLKKYQKAIRISFLILASLIFIWILFLPFPLGVADQGDFDRIMGSSGLSLLDSDSKNPDFIRFLKFIVTDYKISPLKNLFTAFNTSTCILIVFISSLCRILGLFVFKTQYLAIAYFLIYLFSIHIILKTMEIKSILKNIFISCLALFIFFDGNYLIWFNSLYGEPMMISTLLLFISSVLYYSYYKYSLKKTEKIFSKIIYMFIATLFFICSKLQVSLYFPFFLIFMSKIVWDNRKILSKLNLFICTILLLLIIVYPVVLNSYSSNLSKDTQYNSVFYGVLNGSETPREDLIDLGLNPDMAVEAGKHAYLSPSEYVKYIPRTEITEKEFYSKISNGKLAKFYLFHPFRLIKGMEYTSSKSFFTSTSLGKSYYSYSEEPIIKFNRFTTWSYIREHFFPKHLWFIISVYLIVFIYSIRHYIKNRYNPKVLTNTFMLWLLIIISGLQFPMPFIGNGQADTAKQLFLFNFIFDIFIFLIISKVVFKVIDYCRD